MPVEKEMRYCKRFRVFKKKIINRFQINMPAIKHIEMEDVARIFLEG